MTISSGQPKRRSRMSRSSSATRRAARIGPRSVSGAPVRRSSHGSTSASSSTGRMTSGIAVRVWPGSRISHYAMRNHVAWPGVILVTGGAGFIGSHIVDALRAEGHEVRVLDVREPGQDVRDPATVERSLEGVTAVCHQAAMVGLGADMSDITDFVSHNDLGTATLLKALAARRFRGRLVLASSMVVYGEGRYACAEHGELPAPPRAASDLEAGHFDPRRPRCGGRLEPPAAGPDAP